MNHVAMKSETLETSDGLRLDARIQGPDHPDATVVWCHPHPLMGGTMFAPLMSAVAGRLSDAGLGVLRFDFRGVGASSGTHGQGIAEVADVGAAVNRAAELSPRVIVAGWSFGGAVALRYALSAPSIDHTLAVAPAFTDPDEFGVLDGARTTLIIGSRDAVVDNEAIRALATSIEAAVVELPADHLFVGQGAAVAAVIAAVVQPN